MPLDIQHVVARELKELVVPIPHPETGERLGEVRLSYDPLAYNWKVEQSLLVDAKTLPASTVREVLCTFVKDWDLTDGGVPIPISPEGLLAVDFQVLQVPVAQAVVEDLTSTVGKARKTGLSSPSPTARPPRSRSKAAAASRGRR